MGPAQRGVSTSGAWKPLDLGGEWKRGLCRWAQLARVWCPWAPGGPGCWVALGAGWTWAPGGPGRHGGRAATGPSAVFQEVSARPAEPPQSRQPCPGSWCSGGAGLWAATTSCCRPSSSSSCTPPGEAWALPCGGQAGIERGEGGFLALCADLPGSQLPQEVLETYTPLVTTTWGMGTPTGHHQR